jgi:hypothetical protein
LFFCFFFFFFFFFVLGLSFQNFTWLFGHLVHCDVRFSLDVPLFSYFLFYNIILQCARILKSSSLWDITPCSSLKVNRRFEGTCHLHLQGRRISQVKNQLNTGGEQSYGEPGYRSRYCDWLRVGRPNCRSLSPGRGKFSPLHVVKFDYGALGPTQSPLQWVLGALSPGVKRPRREADHSLPTSAEVKNTRMCTSTPPYIFMTQCLISLTQGQRYNCFTFTLRSIFPALL